MVGKFFGRGVFNCSARLCFAKRVGGALGVGMGVGTTVSRPKLLVVFFVIFLRETPPRKKNRPCGAAKQLRGACGAAERRRLL